MTLEARFADIRAVTDFWLYLFVWSEIGRRPAWIGSRRVVRKALAVPRKRA